MTFPRTCKVTFFGVLLSFQACTHQPTVPAGDERTGSVRRADAPAEYPQHSDEFGLIESRNWQVKTGYPFDEAGSIWVKGSEGFESVTISDLSGRRILSARLKSPSYVRLFTGSFDANREYRVRFSPGRGDERRETTVKTASKRKLVSKRGEYSVVFYGCLQPFTAKKTVAGLRSDYFNTSNGFPLNFFKTFSDAVMQTGGKKVNGLFPNARLLVGTGDQVYMDAGYENNGAKKGTYHPLSAWVTKGAESVLRIPASSYKNHVEQTYRAFGSFKYLNRVQAEIPQVNVWDDHEIRDGWGSQGNEHEPPYPAIFEAARNGFLDHQFLSGPQGSSISKLKGNSKPMNQTFSVGHYEGFAFDLRSNRNYKKCEVIDPKQMKDFTAWLDEQKRGQRIVIVSSMPLFLKNNEAIEKLTKLKGTGLADDSDDAWSSTNNEKQQHKIIKLILRKRMKDDIKPIFVSGDYHKGAVSEIWYSKPGDSEENKRVLGYEIVASGLYHEGIQDSFLGWGFDRAEAQRVGGHFVKLKDDSSCVTDVLDPHVIISKVKENFAGLVMKADKTEEIKMVFGDTESNSGEVATIPLKWNKPYSPKAEKRYGPKQIFLNAVMLNFLRDTNYFIPRKVEYKSFPLEIHNSGYIN